MEVVVASNDLAQKRSSRANRGHRLGDEQSVLHSKRASLPIGGSLFTLLRSCGIFRCSAADAARTMPSAQIESERRAVVSADFRERNPVAHLPSNGMPIAFTVATTAISMQLRSTPRVCDADARCGRRRSKLVQH